MDTPDQVPGRKNISTRPVPTTDQVQGRKESKFKAQMDEKENDRQIKALKDRVEVLENQLKSRSSSDADCVKCATLEKALHQSTQYIDRLTAELETAKKQSAQEMDRLKVALETANENKDTETACLKKQVEELKTTTHQSSVPNDTKKLQEQLDQNKQQMDRQASELKIVKSELTTLKSLSESQNNSSKINTGLQDKIGSMKKQITQKDTEIGNKKSEIDALKVEINDLKKTIDTLRREKTMEKTAPPGRDDVGDIKQQLSKATHEIDELKSSDEIRPTKLAEIYSEMYDNEWTDAFEELEKQGSKELNIISDLLKILQDTLKFCGLLAEQYIANLQKSASKLQEKTSTTNQYQKLHLLKELRKSYAPSLADEVFSLYVKEKNLKFGKTPKVEAYTRSCVKLSWLMSVQDPAVVIDVVKTPSKFDFDRYRSYTKSGTIMEFVVWPTMLLHIGGPILMKGVAQCK
ncbi:myosin-13-like isoform X2 [Dreissena polymorpha]|uniref:myosin-13-like isoform X2 n=1 Tax=Dreissena polymorpha TaxID=45954 RepID=UPI0022648BC0|nr:myosin-13-like isoform X2 [Dreissena polymorpha]